MTSRSTIPLHERDAYLAAQLMIDLGDGELVGPERAVAMLGSPLYVIATSSSSNDDPHEVDAPALAFLKSRVGDAGGAAYPALAFLDEGASYSGLAVTGIGKKAARKLGSEVGNEVIFEITSHELRIHGCRDSWTDARPISDAQWVRAPESDDDFVGAVRRALAIDVSPPNRRAASPGWVLDDGVGLICPACDGALELFGCELRAKDGTRYRAMLYVCPLEGAVLGPHQVPGIYRETAKARRSFLMARGDADRAGLTERRYWCYCIELDDETGDRTGTLPWIYVGQTSKTPAERFEQHRRGYKSSRWVRRHGLHLRPDLYEDQPLLRTQAEAVTYERWLAVSLMANGWSVKGGT